MKKALYQSIFMAVATTCSFSLVVLLCYFCVIRHEFDHIHAILICTFTLTSMMCERVMIECAQEWQQAKDEDAQHALDMADDYASREY